MILWVLLTVEVLCIIAAVLGVALQFGLPVGLITLGTLGVIAIERLTATSRFPVQEKGKDK